MPSCGLAMDVACVIMENTYRLIPKLLSIGFNEGISYADDQTSSNLAFAENKISS